jgi:hypothetical protein
VRVPSRNRTWSLLVSRSVRDGAGVIVIGIDIETVTPCRVAPRETGGWAVGWFR